MCLYRINVNGWSCIQILLYYHKSFIVCCKIIILYFCDDVLGQCFELFVAGVSVCLGSSMLVELVTDIFDIGWLLFLDVIPAGV